MTKEIEKRLAAIEKRNAKVEADKAWETSWTRRVAIMVLTYIVVAVYLYFVVGINPWVNALVPVMGYFLSTITIQFVKSYWVTRHK